MDSIQIIISLVGAIGLGSILGAFFQSLFQHQQQIKEHEHELKSKRYKCIMILMLTKLNPEEGMKHMQDHRPDLTNIKDVEKEIETELLNAILFASDGVIKAMKDFVVLSNHQNYIKAALEMRKDLFGKKTKISQQNLSDILK